VTSARRAAFVPLPSYPVVLALYLVALAFAEYAVTYVNPVLVFPLHGGLLIAIGAYLLSHSEAEHGDVGTRRAPIALALGIAPLIRLISLTLPLAQLDPAFRYVAAGVPMAIGGFLVARAAGFSLSQVGLEWRATKWQVRVVVVSVGLGFVEFLILRPQPLGPLPWTAAGYLPALSIGLFTGFPEELIFRGVMQTATRPFLGRWNWVYVSAIFAVLHLGYQSYVDVLFVFAVGLLYGWVFERTRSIIGVSIGHGVANVVLFFVAPNLVFASALPTFAPSFGNLMATTATALIAIAGFLYWRAGSSARDDAGEAMVVAQKAPPGRRATIERIPLGPLPAGSAAIRATAASGGALRLMVTADPRATEVDPSRNVIPGKRIAVPVMAQVTVTPSEVQYLASRARGIARFMSRDPRAAVIQPGMIVKTTNGEAFRTVKGANLLPARNGVVSSIDIPVEAEVPGPQGNVGALSISVMPGWMEGWAVTVVNPKPLAGGDRREVRRVGIADYQMAVGAVTAALWSDLAARVAERSDEVADQYAQPDTADLVGIQIEPSAAEAVHIHAGPMILTAKATAEFTAVELATLRAAFSAFASESVPVGFEIVPGSLQGRVAAATPERERVSYVVEATSWQVRRTPKRSRRPSLLHN
jgi:membrane protease YdiL (CAAX protease family)